MKGPEKSNEDTQTSESEVLGATELASGKHAEMLGFSELPDPSLHALETELRRTLRPIGLPLGFTDRIVAAAAAQTAPVAAQGRAKVLFFRRSWRLPVGGAIAAGLLAGSFALQEVHHRRQRAEATAMANRQFETASRIEEQTLEHTREQLRRAGVPSID